MLMAAIVVLSFISFAQLRAVQQQADLEAEKILSEVALKINTAYIEGDGFFINMTLQSNILGSDYNMTIAANQALLEVDTVTYAKNLLTQNISGIVTKGLNTVENRKGEIILTQP